MDEHWVGDDPFVDAQDPEAVERERRRQEREAKRRKKQGREPAPQAKPDPGHELPPPPPPAAPSRPAPRPPEPEFDSAYEPRPETAESWLPHPKPQRRGGGISIGARRGIALGLLLLALLGIVFVWALIQPFHGDGEGRVNLEVPEGASVGEVADLLADRGVIANSTLFQIRATLAGKRSEIYPGAYTLAKDMSYGDAIEALSTVPVERTVTITIPEGYGREQVAGVAKESGLPGNYMKASKRSKLLDPAKYGGANADSLEGFLFPATYELSADAKVDSLVKLQLQAFKDRLAGIPMKYARAKNLTVYDVLTIASMIEREVSEPKERKLVASVIYNRLRDGIPLGIDATTRFAVGNFTEPLTQSQLESDSPYNTRIHAGLPPGPIGNPGEDSIRAAAKPARSNYLYYVVKPGTCGLHSFSSDFAQFERDVAAYNQAREEAGGKSPTSC